jgi:hypothetical protein
MVSIVTFGKTCSGAKNSRMGTLNFGLYKKDFENLGIVLYSIEMFSRVVFQKMEKRRRRFYKSGIMYKCSPNQLFPCNHITPAWDGA